MEKKMDKDKIYKIIYTIVSLIVIVGGIVGIYFMYQSTYGQRDHSQPITVTKYKGTE